MHPELRSTYLSAYENSILDAGSSYDLSTLLVGVNYRILKYFIHIVDIPLRDQMMKAVGMTAVSTKSPLRSAVRRIHKAHAQKKRQ